MDWKGKINFEKAITLNGKAHGIEREPSLPTFDPVRDDGRVVFTEDDQRLYVGGTNHETGSTGWSELTPGGVGEHSHDDKYYRESEVDAFFEGESLGKKQVDWSNVVSKPLSYNPSQHNNDAHSEEYITAEGVTFTNLANNGSVGVSSNQVAVGNHNHDTQYAPIQPNANTIIYDNTTSLISSDNVQTAIDELDSRIDNIDNRINKIYWVDNTRTDSYAELGNMARPFKTISAATGFIDSNESGDATILLSQSTYNEDVTLNSKTSLKSLGQSMLTGVVTIGNASSGSNIIENILFKNSVTVNMIDTVKFSNTTFEDNSNLTISSGSAEGDISINTTSGEPSLIMSPGAGTFFGTNCSFSSSNKAIIQQSGDLILSNCDIISTSTVCVESTGGVVNISDSRIFNTGSGYAMILNNNVSGGSSASNPNILMNLYKHGDIQTNDSVTIIDGIYGNAGVQGTDHVYQTSLRVGYDPTNSGLASTSVQTAIDELANSHSDFQKTSMIYVDAARTDDYEEKGTIDRPYKSIDDATANAISGDTIFCFKGAYSAASGDIVLPDNVNLLGLGQGKTNFYSKVITGSTGKCRIENISIRNELEINTSAFIQYVHCNNTVTVNAGMQAEGFSIEATTGTALIINTSDDVTFTLNTISTTVDAYAIEMPSTNTAALYLQTSRVENNSATLPTIYSRGGSVALLTTTLVNNNAGPIADLQNSATASSPNMLSQVFHSGGPGSINTGSSPTVVEGVHGGDPIGMLLYRSSTQLNYDNLSSGLSAETVQDALDEIVGSLGTGNSFDIAYSGTLDSSNVKDALDELDFEKSNIGHNHNDLYYTQTQVDTTFVARTELSDTITHALRAASQEVELTGVSVGDESGLVANTTYDFNLIIDGTTTNQAITPAGATNGYQELGLTGITTSTETGLAPDTYYYQVKPNNNIYEEFNIVIDPAERAEVIGTNDMTAGHDWLNYNKDFNIIVNGGTETTISLATNLNAIDFIINEINTQIPTGAEAFNDGTDHIGVRTLFTGAVQTLEIISGADDALPILGITPGTYSGNDNTSGYHDINLNSLAVDGNESGLTLGNTYDINAEIDSTPSNLSITFSSATNGYQELGLSGITLSTETGLAEGTQYYFLLNDVEYSITTPASILSTPEQTEVTFTDDTANSNVAYDGTYFDIYDGTSLYRVWYDVGNTSTMPANGGGTLVEVDITTTSTIDDITTSTATALDALSPFSSSSTTSPLVVDAINGSATDADAGTAPVTISVLQQGVDGTAADLTWGNILTLLNDATSDTNTPTSGEVYQWTIESGDVRATDSEAASWSIVELNNGTSGTDLFTSLSGFTALETTVEGTSDDLTTYGELVDKLNSVTTGATWSIFNGNIRLQSDTTGSASSITISNGTTNDLVTSLAGIQPTNFTSLYIGEDAAPAETIGSIVLTDGYNFTNKNENIRINGTPYTMDQMTTSLTEVVGLLNAKISPEGVEAFESGNFVGIRTLTEGSSATFEIGTNGAASTMGIATGVYTGVDKTDTTWGNLIDVLNASTSSNVTWSIEGDDVRCSYNGTGSLSKVELQAGTSGTDLYEAVGVTSFDTPVDGVDATTKVSNVIAQLNTVTTDATWTFDSGNLLITRDQNGSAYSVEVTSGTNDVFSNMTGFVQINSPVVGLDSDTTTGSDLVGVKGITDIQPEGKSSGEAATLQEILEAGVGQLSTSEPSPNPGKAWFDVATNTLYIYNGTVWVSTTLS